MQGNTLHQYFQNISFVNIFSIRPMFKTYQFHTISQICITKKSDSQHNTTPGATHTIPELYVDQQEKIDCEVTSVKYNFVWIACEVTDRFRLRSDRAVKWPITMRGIHTFFI